ncbi:MAG: ferrous iron transport protein B [Lentisphaeria bacterium]|nr:ferrous iron transport protein B [Lentisphaeria bacterium]MBQ8753951.1 ferrous iron transport protein B [Lentisphaeria bacterium]MBQ9776221.1 ferrous iron transport protein B [Lentisphaeria bacterium]
MKRKFRIALAGNPNCGKTSIFNALTGARQHVGNYPGVTVESKSGTFTLNGMEIELIDLPGIYSLSSSSPEEEVAFSELITPGIDLILNVVDSTIPHRSLYLTTQLAELHIPMLLAFNMSDDAKKKGLKFDIPKLEKYFGSPIVQTIGSKTSGVRPLLEQLAKTLNELDDHGVPMLSYGKDADDAINALAAKIDALKSGKHAHIPSRFFAIKLLERDSSALNLTEFANLSSDIEEEIKHLRTRHAIDTDTFMADRRYAMLAGACRDSISMTQEKRREISDKIDVVMTNKFLGLPIFLLIIYITFWFTFTLAEPFMGWIEEFFAWLCDAVKNVWNPETLPYLRHLVTDGVISGVGGVIVFLPNILFLFFAIAILEDSGYMARAAFVMDGIMRKFGLQGRSFVPLVLGFGCTVPAIMATRTIESEKDRTVTIMVLPLMSCGARLPIYALIIPAFFAHKYQATVMWLIYIIGVTFAMIGARIMKSTLFKGDGEVYLMELPTYRMPTVKSLMLHMWDRGRMYLQKAGTIILATSVILYICNTFPQKQEFSKDYDKEIEQLEKKGDAKESIAKLENERMAELMEYTISGRVGKTLEPFFAPIGFDWKLTTASIGALAAKEVFVSQLGILFAEGETDEESAPLREHLRESYTPLQGFCIMLFCLLSIPCLATLAIIRRELNSWKMPLIEAGALFLLAYITTLIVYQAGKLLEIGTKFLG